MSQVSTKRRILRAPSRSSSRRRGCSRSRARRPDGRRGARRPVTWQRPKPRRHLEERARGRRPARSAAHLVGAAPLARHRSASSSSSVRSGGSSQVDVGGGLPDVGRQVGEEARGSGARRRPRLGATLSTTPLRSWTSAPPSSSFVERLAGGALDQRRPAGQHLRGLARHHREVRRDEPRGREARHRAERGARRPARWRAPPCSARFSGDDAVQS